MRLPGVAIFGQATLEIFCKLKVDVRDFEVELLALRIGRQPRLVFEVRSPLSIYV